jgi:Holliday junction resolvase
MATPESKVKAEVKKILDELGAYHFMPATHGYGRSGVPDICGCLNGRFFGIECKAGKGKTTALQDRELKRISTAGGIALIVDETGLATLREDLQGLIMEKRKGRGIIDF